jgi:hypothetical protein
LRAATLHNSGDAKMEGVPVPRPGEVLACTGAVLTRGMGVEAFEQHGRREGTKYEIQTMDRGPL